MSDQKTEKEGGTVSITLVLEPYAPKYGGRHFKPDLTRLLDLAFWQKALRTYSRGSRDPIPGIQRVRVSKKDHITLHEQAGG